MAKSNQHSPFFELAKTKYEEGKWTIKMLRALVAAGKITAEEFTEITGEDYEVV